MMEIKTDPNELQAAAAQLNQVAFERITTTIGVRPPSKIKVLYLILLNQYFGSYGSVVDLKLRLAMAKPYDVALHVCVC